MVKNPPANAGDIREEGWIPLQSKGFSRVFTWTEIPSLWLREMATCNPLYEGHFTDAFLRLRYLLIFVL